MEMSVGDLPAVSNCSHGALLARGGHSAAVLAGSIFVLGGLSQEGGAVPAIQRINCQNGRVDSLVLDHPLPILAPALFPHQQSLYIWGGLSLHPTQPSVIDSLQHFDGTRLHTVIQRGAVPAARQKHSYTLVGRKYLIIFGGCDQRNFFKDWHLLNLTNFEWTRLRPSIDVGYCLRSSMTWVNGRGVLLTEESYSPSSASLLNNKFYQFFVTDFKKGLLIVKPLDMTSLPFLREQPATHVLTLDNSSLLLLSLPAKNGNHFAWKVETESLSYETLSQVWEWGTMGAWNAVATEGKVYLLGGESGNANWMQIWPEKRSYKRNVCGICRLYYDEEWFRSSSEVYRTSFREDYDYNYALKMDNRILGKMSSYITTPLSALALLFQSLQTLGTHSISFGVHTSNSSQQARQYLKMAASGGNLGCFGELFALNKLGRQSEKESEEQKLGKNSKDLLSEQALQSVVIKVKMALLRLCKAFVISVRRGEGLEVMFMSAQQMECPNSGHMPATVYRYHTGDTSSPSHHIVAVNTQAYLSNPSAYEQIGSNSIQFIGLGCEELENELHVDFTEEEQTNTGQPHHALTTPKFQVESSSVRKPISLLQLCFQPDHSPPAIYHSNHQAPILHINITDILQKDAQQGILQTLSSPVVPGCIRSIKAYQPPAEYWFRKVLIYHRGRILTHLTTRHTLVCGVIELKKDTPLDITGTRPLHSKDEQHLRTAIRGLQPPKRKLPQ